MRIVTQLWDLCLFQYGNESVSISVMDEASVESQERSDWVFRKPYAPAFGFKNTHLFPLRVPPDARLTPLTALCLPFSGRTFTPALRPRGHTPLQPPLICVHLEGHKSGKRCSVSGSALLSNREEPCPLRLQTVFSTQKPSQNRNTDFAGAKAACFRCTQPDL